MTPEQCRRISKAKTGTVSPFKGLYKSGIGEKFCIPCETFFKCDSRIGHKRWLKQTFCSKTCALIGNVRTLGKNLGEENGSWKGGITPLHKMMRSSYEMTQWRKEVFIRDDYTCQMCLVRGGKLVSHHIKSFRNFPELRLEVSNGQTLCEDCHKKTDNFSGKVFHELHG